MYLKSASIRNFRILDDIEVEFSEHVNVIVGPNASGKTTILEAIRLAKALLAPRTANEGNQSLFALGAVSPHLPQRFNLPAVARDISRPALVRCTYRLSPDELDWLEANRAGLAREAVFARIGQPFAMPAQAIAYLSSPNGVSQLTEAQADIDRCITQTRADNGDCTLGLQIAAPIGPTSVDRGEAGTLLAALDRRLPPNQTCFSYFPADRALPTGEQPVQLGSADAMNQLESHNSQPQLKYQRLKNTIFSFVVASEESRKRLTESFQLIFEKVLRGRQLIGCGVNEIGLLSIRVRDSDTNREFDLDGMSSGEKGLILIFLTLEHSLAARGIVLLDEPELHLNPAVCRDLLAFFAESYAKRRHLQFIFCSHSPEILAGALERDDCSLYHLLSDRMVTKVRIGQKENVSEALRRLGTSEIDGLLYKATLFVEGPDDVTILEAGFGDLLRRHKVKDLGGRKEVEKQISLLQEAELPGDPLSPRYFIFDKDDAPTTLKSSTNVKIKQWSRRCLENFLLDIDVLADLLMNEEIVKTPLKNQGEVTKLLRELALSQLDEYVARQIFTGYKYSDYGLRSEDVSGGSIATMASLAFSRIATSQAQISKLTEAEWISDFIARCEELKSILRTKWETTWQSDCDGKKLFGDLHQTIVFRMPLRRFKTRVITYMRLNSSEGWRTVESVLKELLSS